MSGINRAVNGPDDSFLNTVASMKQEMLDMKTKQPIGADSLAVIGIPESPLPLSVGPITIAAGSSLTLNVTNIPVADRLTLWNFAFTILVDSEDDFDYQWPAGSALSLNARELFVFDWLDWADSSDTTNTRVYKIRIRNSDPSGTTHDYYVKFKAYAPLSTV